jgi:MYXO-CTERM domain-containing protein
LIGSGVALSLVAACGAVPEPETTTEQSAVTGGEVSPASDNAVVELGVVRPLPYLNDVCTGVLVAPNVVVTVLDCLTNWDGLGLSYPFVCEPDGSLGTPDTGGGWIGDPVKPSDVRVFWGSNLGDRPPAAYGQQIFTSGTPEACEDNIGVLVLDRDLPSAGYPLRLDRDVEVGEDMTIIGWGMETQLDARYRRDVTVLEVGPDDTSQGTTDVAPRSFLIGTGPCSGDRGAPTISTETGAVAGIFARWTNDSVDCRSPYQLNRVTKIAPYKSMFEQAFAAAGAKLRSEASGTAPSAKTPKAGCSVSPNHVGSSTPAFGFVLLLGLALLARKRGFSA